MTPNDTAKQALAKTIRKKLRELTPYLNQARQLGLTVVIVTADTIQDPDALQASPLHISITETIDY